MNKRVNITLLGSILNFFLFDISGLFAQTNYATNSVLATGSWYKIGIVAEGIYKIDVPFLNNLGINMANLPSNSIKIYGNGGAMLSEKNIITNTDDLIENAIEVNDGGDGVFNGNDYFIFYGASADKWSKDSVNKKFIHKKNLYSDTVFYYLTFGNNGRRIVTQPMVAGANKFVSSYNERLFYEKDLVNFLNSGKEWLGEEFSSISGNSLTKNFNYTIDGLDNSTSIQFSTNLVSRSIGGASSFNLAINNLQLPSINMGQVTGYYLDAFATSITKDFIINSNSNNINLTIGFLPYSSSAQGWLNWFEINCRRSLAFTNSSQLFFRDWNSAAQGNISQFTINNSSLSTVVWDISDGTQPIKMLSTFSIGQTSFTNNSNTLKEYIAFQNTGFITPFFIEKINNQNLHNSSIVDYLIVTHPLFITEANKLANFHRNQYGYKVEVATTSQIFNEFASGIPDPSAIKNFVKMHYDKANGDTTKQPKFLLLFGAASFDYKNRLSNNTNFVPAYESTNSLEPLLSYTTDDFYAFLKDGDDINENLSLTKMNLAVGRLPVTSIVDAKVVVDKIINYHSIKTLGSWKNNTVFVADDKDNNVHLNDAEFISKNAFTVNNLFNQKKIFLDAFPLVSGSGGGKYPQVNATIVNQVQNGCLLFNYSGHGGYKQLADEVILSLDEANQFNNANKLPLFITATCDFAPYDDPTKSSLGSYLLQGSEKGAIALVTTSRVVFAYSNRILNNQFLNFLLQKSSNNTYTTLGQAIKYAKNNTLALLNDVVNTRKFVILGDPAMQLAFPKLNASITSINGNNALVDTLKALGKYNFEGRITDENGNLKTDFNGTVYPTVFDKSQTYQTLGNDVASPISTFAEQQNIIYKGKATVKNGLFNFSFIVPKDINYLVDKGRVSLYAENGLIDGNGVSSSFFVGSSETSIVKDNIGPDLKVFLNDEKFVNGGLTDENPLLIVKLFDSSGINTTSSGIGHDMVAVLDGDENNAIVLNNYYEAEKDNYQKGIVNYQFNNLTEGKHFLKIKAWDIANNSKEEMLEFTVGVKKGIRIADVYNYPNPFSEKTSFWFEHNQTNENLSVLINIYTVSGKLVHQIQEQIQAEGNRINNIFWNGRDKNSEKLAKGVYIYRIIVINSAGERAEKLQKLYLF